MPQKKIKIKPSFIKSSKGKVTDIYIDIKTYNAISERIKTFERKQKTIKKSLKK